MDHGRYMNHVFRFTTVSPISSFSHERKIREQHTRRRPLVHVLIFRGTFILRIRLTGGYSIRVNSVRFCNQICSFYRQVTAKDTSRIHVIHSREISGIYFLEFLRVKEILLRYFHVFHTFPSSYHTGEHLCPAQAGKHFVPRFPIFKPINAIFLHCSKKSVFTGTISSSIPNSFI